jgi:AsmA protein
MIKRLVIISGLLLLLVVVALVAAAILIDPNDYRDRIQDITRDATGRELEIVDNMKLSVFPWIGVEFGAVRLGNAEGFGPEPFARISGARVKVRLIPLFSRRIEVDTVTLHGLELRLAIAADGRSNWDDLVGATAEQDAGAASPPDASPADAAFALPAMLTISGLDIRDAAVYWRDDTDGTAFDITGFNLESGKIEPDQPVDLELYLNFSSGEPALDGHIALAMRVTAHFADEFFRIENLRLRSRLNGEMLPAQPLTADLDGNIAIDLKRETVEMPAFTLKTLGVTATGGLRGQEILDEPRFAGTLNIAGFSPRDLLKALGEEALETADPAALSSASLSLDFEIGPEHASAGDIRLGLDDSLLRGSVTVRDFDAPAVRFNLELDHIDADRYLPPDEEAPVATPATAPAAALELPMETLRELDVDGSLAIGRLRISGLAMTGFQLKTRAKDGVIAVSPISAELYGGRYTGNMKLDARSDVPSFSIDEAVTGVQAEPLLKDMLDLDFVSGVADFRIRATTRGASDEELRRSLSGSGNFSFRNGAIKGFNTAQMIREATARLQGRTPPADASRETDFTELSGSLQIGDGLVRNEDLRASSPYLRLAGNGHVDIVNERIDYRLRARIVDTAAGQGGAGLDDVKGVDIPIRITGALMEPDIRIDADFLRNLLRDKLAPQVEQLRQELRQEVETHKEELKREAEEQKQELKQELQEKVDQQLRRLLR